MIVQNIKPNNYNLNVILSAGRLFFSILLVFGYLGFVEFFMTPRYPSWGVKILTYPLIITVVDGSIILVVGLTAFIISKLFFKR